MVLAILLVISVPAFSQNAINGLNTATNTLKTYIAPLITITMAIGGIVGIVGGMRVYTNWNNGEKDISKELMGWGGSCVFLVISALVIKSFFGL